jgi:hypothetical protein
MKTTSGTKHSTILRVARKLERRRLRRAAPRIDSFAAFLGEHARVKCDGGYVPYHFAGREALRPMVERLDQILAAGEPDVSLALCGGAQFGKTVLMLNLLVYLVAVRFRNVGYYLPDDDLVSGLVDGKLRPDVLDQIPWLARLIAVGKTLSPSGRAVNRKGAFLCTDGTRTALAFMRGLGKIPTSFSMDVVIQDEKDDLPEEHARFLAGRMTASNLRLSLIIGTQRYHGAGQNLAFTEGTQHVALVRCPGCGRRENPETAWPGICRLESPELPVEAWPKLTVEGHFAFESSDTILTGNHERQEIHEEGRGTEGRRIGNEGHAGKGSGVRSAFPIPYTPGQRYVLACGVCGTALDREHPEWHAQAPEQEAQRRWSYRISQLAMPGIELAQVVAAWQLAVRDPEQMAVFCTDRLALPKSTTQTLTPGVLQEARGGYVLELRTKKLELRSGNGELRTENAELRAGNGEVGMGQMVNYGGLDLGDQCWFVARAVEAEAPHQARLLWIEAMAAERVRSRVPELFAALDLRALCVDAGPLRDLARDLTFLLNGLDEAATPSSSDAAENISFAGGCGLRWRAASQQWQNARCAAVEFTQREGQGLRHKVGRTQEGRVYPLLAAHRDETIERVVRELVPSDDWNPRLLEKGDGTASRVTGPRFVLPTATEESRAALDVYERHLLAGARQERSGDGRSLRYLDKCENHFLLATAYAGLAELLAPAGVESRAAGTGFRAWSGWRSRQERSLSG